jgi:predicted Holliday junction resolvase-like endonuclease
MSETFSQKEKLLMMMTDIYNQLEELEFVLETSFTELHDNWKNEELNKIAEPNQRISNLEKKIEEDTYKKFEEQKDAAYTDQKSSSLKFELGY